MREGKSSGAQGTDVERTPAATEPQADSALVLGDPRFIYVPLWDALRNDVFAHRCTPLWEGRDGQLKDIELVTSEYSNPDDRLAIDLEVFDKAISHINRIVSQYGILKIVIPVHLSTLLGESLRGTYLSECGDSVWSVIDNVAFEIVDVGTAAATDLAAALDFIQPYGSQVFICLDSDDAQGVPVGADPSKVFIGRNARRMMLEGEALAEALTEFGKHVASLPFRAYVHGMRTLEEAAAAVASGITIIGSEAVAPALDEPDAAAATEEAANMLRNMIAERVRG